MSESNSQPLPHSEFPWGDANDLTADLDLGFDGAEDILRTWRRGMRPDPDLTVSEWADQHRSLSSRAGGCPRYRRMPPRMGLSRKCRRSRHPWPRIRAARALAHGLSKPTPATYRTTNWRANNAALKQRGSLHIWFDPETVWLAEPSGKRGRPATFSDAAIQACLTLKALFGLPLRQATGLVASLIELAGLDWSVQDFSTLSRRPSGLNVPISFRHSTGALHLLIDSTGIKAEGDGEWFAKKHGPSKPRQWRNAHSTEGGHRCGHAGDHGDQSDRQPSRRCRAAKRHRFERTGEGCCPNC